MKKSNNGDNGGVNIDSYGPSIGYLENSTHFYDVHNEPQWTLDELIHEFSSDSIRSVETQNELFD